MAVSEVELMQLQSQVRQIQYQLASFLKKKAITPGTNPVITYDENGLVVGSRSLQTYDIPELPILKIMGLEEILYRLQNPEEDSRIPTLLAKLNELIDAHNDISDRLNSLQDTVHQIRSDVEDMRYRDALKSADVYKDEKKEDAPAAPTNYDDSQTIVELNKAVASLTDMLTKQALEINGLRSQLYQKAEISSVEPGIYTKVSVTSEGTISNGEQLTAKDLPALYVHDINDLQVVLNRKADAEFVTGLSNTVALLMNQVAQMKPTDQIEQEITAKATRDDLVPLQTQITSLIQSSQNYQRDMDQKFNQLTKQLVDLASKCMLRSGSL